MFENRTPIAFAFTAVVRQDGGIAAVNRNVLRSLLNKSEKSQLVTVISFFDQPEDRPEYLPTYVKFKACGGRKLSFVIALIVEAIKSRWLVIDHVTLAKPLLPLLVLGWKRLIVIAHGSESWRKVRPSSQRIFKCAALTLTNSQFTLQKMLATIGEFAGVACPLGLSSDFPLLEKPPERTTDPPLCLRCADNVERLVGCQALLLVGRMHEGEREKGTVELLNVLPRVLERFPDVQLIFCGDGNDRTFLENLAIRQGVGANVLFPGRVSNKLLTEIYRRCYAYVMPSRQEGFGLVYLEAMNAAKPCIGSHDDGAIDVIVDRETGYLVNHDKDNQGIFLAIMELLESPYRARQMGLNGFLRLHETFTSEKFQQRFSRAVDTAISNRQARIRKS